MIRSSRPDGNLLVRCVCIVAALLLANAAVAAYLPHEDFGSLLYRSTDVVVAELQFSGNTAVAARVTEPLIGTLHAGERLPGLSNALASYTSLANGTRVILFLASCPRDREQCGDSPQARYRLVQSGVYLIDRYDRVHQYYQQSNPGLYVPQGYDEERSTLAQDLTASEAQKYPTVQQVKAHIATVAASVARVHALLAMPITKQQVPLLLHLVDRTSTDTTDCDLRQADAIAEDVAEKAKAVGDPALLLHVDTLLGTPKHAFAFVSDPNSIAGRDTASAQAGVSFLLHAYANRQLAIDDRRMAAALLLELSLWQTGSSKGLHNAYLQPQSQQRLMQSQQIFNDAGEDAQLRALSLQLLDPPSPAALAQVRRVYSTTASEELQFAIEKRLAAISAPLYASLHPPAGPVASRLSLGRVTGCNGAKPGVLRVVEDFVQPTEPGGTQRHASLVDRAEPMMISTASGVATPVQASPVSAWFGVTEAHLELEMPLATSLPPGEYTLAVQRTANGQVRTGHGIRVVVRGASNGNHIEVDRSALR